MVSPRVANKLLCYRWSVLDRCVWSIINRRKKITRVVLGDMRFGLRPMVKNNAIISEDVSFIYHMQLDATRGVPREPDFKVSSQSKINTRSLGMNYSPESYEAGFQKIFLSGK